MTTLKQPVSQLLTIKETAHELRVSEKTVRRWIETRELIAHKLGRQWRISWEDLANFVKIRRQV
jgi:excisionase family DNA binding protein